MNDSNSRNVVRDRLEHFGSVLWDYRMMIIVPTVICTLLAVGYSVLKSNTWTARQSLDIRDDLTGQSFKPGRFESFDSLKLAQETILEVARKPQVIRNSLQQLGPPPTMLTGKSGWPNEETIEEIQGQITLTAPNGAEFGKTEVVLLNIKESTRERARQFIEAMLDEVDQKLNEVRTLKVESMVLELSQAVESAQASLTTSSQKLQEMDVRFGADLSALRGLNLQQTGDGSLQQTIVEIRKEQRVATEKADSAIKQRELLIKVLEEPQQVLVTSGELLRMQPRLNQLVVGLSKAELELAAKRGKYTDRHVDVISAKSGIRDIRYQILKEIQAAIYGLGVRAENGQLQLEKLKHQEAKFEQRLSELSGARVAYDKLEKEVRKKTEVLGQSREDLAQIQSVGTSTVNLLTRIGEPQVSTRPDGPGKRVIVGAGAIGGLLFGLGLVMFIAPPYEGRDQIVEGDSQPNRFPTTDHAVDRNSWRNPPAGFNPAATTATRTVAPVPSRVQEPERATTCSANEETIVEPPVAPPVTTEPLVQVENHPSPSPIQLPPNKITTHPVSGTQSHRRENIRPIDLTRTPPPKQDEQQIPKRRKQVETRTIEDLPLETPKKPIRPPEILTTKAPSSGTKIPREDISAEEIVKLIRAQQIAAANAPLEKMPVIQVPNTGSDKSHKTNEANPKSEPESQKSRTLKPDIQKLMEQTDTSIPDPEPAGESKEAAKPAPVQDQLKQIQDSISSFCEPLQKKKSDLPKGKQDF